MKRKFLILLVIVIVLIVSLICYFKFYHTNYITDYEWLYDEAIQYLENEIREESDYKSQEDFQVFTDYKGFGIQENGTKKYAYMWILDETYYVKDGELQSGEGSSMPYKFTFENNQVIDYEIPKDGSEYGPSIKKMFPIDVANKIIPFIMDSTKLDRKVKEHYAYLSIDDSISSVTNSTKPYIPDGVEVANPNDNSGTKATDMKFNRSPENVKIKVIEDTISRDSASILITDNNDDKYGWGVEFHIEKKVNDSWEQMNFIRDDLAWIEIAYNLDENNQLIQKVQYGDYYGSLENGTYRIEKRVYDNGYVSLYSNEFEIK